MEVSVSSDTCPTADEGMASANTNPIVTRCGFFMLLLRRASFNAFDYLTNSISLGRHSLVKNGSSGL